MGEGIPLLRKSPSLPGATFIEPLNTFRASLAAVVIIYKY